MIKTPKPSVVENLIKQVPPYIITHEHVINSWHKKDGIHTSPNEFSMSDEKETKLSLGDFWETGYDMTSWFSSTVTVPKEMDGKKVYLQIDFGGEAIVRVNGEIIGAVSSDMNSGWVHRDILHLPNPIKGGTVYNIEIEATVNSGGFCDDAMAGAKTTVYSMKTARLIAVHELTEKYYFLLKNCADSINVIKDEVIKSRVYRAVDNSVHSLVFDMGKKAFLDSVPNALSILETSIDFNYSIDNAKVIMTGHSHLDVAWLWTVKEIVRKTARTFSNNLKLMDIYPDFKFCQSQAVLYDFMKKHYPEIFEQVKQKVKSGNWEITGTAWVEADTNIASGESLIRQLLYGRQFFLKEFGVCSDIYWLPDCFGFSWALPQIIKKSGLKYFLTSKLRSNDTNEFPHSQFIWRSHSGDEAIAYLVSTSYNGEYTAFETQQSFYGNQNADVTGVSLSMYGYGDGGGGCTYGMVENGSALEKIPGLIPSKSGTASEFFTLLEEKRDVLPIFDGEMYYENHRGTYTSQAPIKKYNRKGEFLFRNAEILSVIANTETDFHYDKDSIEKGIKLLLVNQFHDILPGTSIHEAHTEALLAFEEMTKIGSTIKNSALHALNKTVSANCPSIVVWNYNTHSTSSLVVCEIPHEAASIKDACGAFVPAVFFEKEGKRFVEFISADVPSIGYKVFTLSCDKNDVKPFVKATKNLLENSILRITFDDNGNILSITDKRYDRELLTGMGNLLTIFQDKPVHESAWNLELSLYKKRWDLTKANSVDVINSSPINGTIRVKRSFGKSFITQDISLKANSDMIEFSTFVDWYETEKTLKAAFPVDIRSTFASYEIAHGAIERPAHFNTSFDLAKFEVSAHKWADLSQADYGISILNDCKYGYDIHENTMRITLMRSPNCPDTTSDHGSHSFTYAFYPHKGRWHDGETVNKAFELNMPLEAFYVDGEKENQPVSENSFLSVSHNNVIIDALKKAEDENGFILRVYEAEGKMVNTEVKTCFSHFDLYECNMMEEENALIKENTSLLEFNIRPFEVKTFRLVP
ncbi:MAG TPA: glycoside hydrolase family 38 C-terminal domain-containing protein [Oscillospiraceae bacterium]|nr:glycoside hydrolase family 38 C-terminal domain-containing protein [Oscillospiraceae bacterium]